MGYSYYVVDDKECGYSVEATCEYPGCNNKIDRGLAYKCGGYPGEGEDFCSGYFCYDHLFVTIDGNRCFECSHQGEWKENW